jgi:hypothetical protein
MSGTSPQDDNDVKISAGGLRKLGNLVEIKDKTAAEVIFLRGGTQSQVRQLQSGYEQLTVGELAEKAVQGDAAAETAIKIIKQARKKGEKYDSR